MNHEAIFCCSRHRGPRAFKGATSVIAALDYQGNVVSK
jgi:hypothetical protein